MTAATVPERVAAGAAWFDEHAPTWPWEIDLDNLYVEGGCDCPLAQVLKTDYVTALTDHGKDLVWAIAHGFDGVHNCGRHYWDDVVALDDEWVRVVTERRQQDHPVQVRDVSPTHADPLVAGTGADLPQSAILAGVS